MNRVGALLWVGGLSLLVPAETSPGVQNPEEGSGEVYPLRDEQEIRRALEQVLSNPEYRRLAPREKSESEEAEGGWIDRLWKWLEQWLIPESSPGEATRWKIPAPLLLIFRLFVYLLVAGVVVAVVALIFKAVGRRTPSMDEAKGKPEAATTELASRPPGELASEEYLNRALALAEGANYNAAIRQLLLGTMSWIERRGLIRYRRGLSNRDYLRAVAEKAHLREPFEHIVVLFEQVYFGRRMATPEGFQECLQEYQRAFRSE